MLNKLRSLDFTKALIVLITLSLMVLKAEWPLAVTIIVLGALQALKTYMDSKKLGDDATVLKDKVAAIENRMAMMQIKR